jgi:hypothetical protein
MRADSCEMSCFAKCGCESVLEQDLQRVGTRNRLGSFKPSVSPAENQELGAARAIVKKEPSRCARREMAVDSKEARAACFRAAINPRLKCCTARSPACSPRPIARLSFPIDSPQRACRTPAAAATTPTSSRARRPRPRPRSRCARASPAAARRS